MERICGIYEIRNKVDGKVYVGQSSDLNKRKIQHFSELDSNRHPNHHLQLAWNKYRDENFVFTIIELTSLDKLTEREQYWIDYFKSYDRKIGYNFGRYAKEPMRNNHHTEKAKKSMSEKRKGKKHGPMRESTKELIRNIRTGSHHKPESIEKMKERMKNRPHEVKVKSGRLGSASRVKNGYTHSYETREKIRRKLMGRITGKKGKTFEDIFGKEMAEKIKKKISDAKLGIRKVERENRECACKCGGTFNCLVTSKKKFIYGHGRRNRECSESTRKLMSLSQKKSQKNRKGKTHTEFYGKEKAEEIRQKHILSLTGKRIYCIPFQGRVFL